MKQDEGHRRHSSIVLGSRITATVSVALVLLVVGVAAMLGIAAHSAGEDIRSRIGFVVVMDENATPAQTAALQKRFAEAPYVNTVHYSSADEVLARWNATMASGPEDDIQTMLGVNPFLPEFEVAVKSRYSGEAALAKITEPLRRLPGVGEVRTQGDLARSINATVNSLTVIFLIVAAALLLISFVLINNTVRLTVYSRRFSIYTMKLVGATAGFIRRPFIIANLLSGVIAGCVAIAVLCGAYFYACTLEPAIEGVLSFHQSAWVFTGLFLLGILICTASALFATNRYLRLGYDRLF